MDASTTVEDVEVSTLHWIGGERVGSAGAFADIWVDKDFALARGWHQGYPKKLGSIWMTRPVRYGRAGPRLEPGGRFGASLAELDRRLVDARFTIEGRRSPAGS